MFPGTSHNIFVSVSEFVQNKNERKVTGFAPPEGTKRLGNSTAGRRCADALNVSMWEKQELVLDVLKRTLSALKGRVIHV